MLFSPDRAISSELISEYLGFIQGIVLGTNGGECCCIASAKIADRKKDGCTASVMGCGIAAGCTASIMGCGIAAGCTASIMGRGIAAGCTALAILGGPGGIAAIAVLPKMSHSTVLFHCRVVDSDAPCLLNVHWRSSVGGPSGLSNHSACSSSHIPCFSSFLLLLSASPLISLLASLLCLQ